MLALRGTSLRIGRRELGGTAIVGGLLLTLGVGLVHVAETRIDSSVAAIIAGTVPLQIIVMRTIGREHPARATQLSALDRARRARARRRTRPRRGLDRARPGGDARRVDQLVDRVVHLQAPRAAAGPVRRRRRTRWARAASSSRWERSRSAERSSSTEPPSRATRSSPGSTSSSSARSSASPRTRGCCGSRPSRSSSRTST